MFNWLIRLWRGFFHQRVIYGDPEFPAAAEVHDARAFPGLPPFDWARLILTEEGGLRLLLFSWLVNVDFSGEPFYQPLIWVEYVPAGEGYGRHWFVALTLPPDRGQATLVFPLDLATLRSMGPVAYRWEGWQAEVPHG